MNPYISTSRIESYAKEFVSSCSERVLIKVAVIKKLPNGQWTVMSLKGKPLGKYKTKSEAVKRLRQIEYFKHNKKKKKKASKDNSYSSIMRELRKSHNEEDVHKFQTEFKDKFDKALIAGVEDPEKDALENAMKCVAFESKLTLEKIASAIDLGDPEYAGKYLSDVLKFVMRRISQERRVKSLENLRKKIYYLNEYEMAAKKVPPSSAIGQSITLLKHILLEHDPKYIRAVLNSVVKHI